MLISVTLFGDIRIAKAIIGLNQNSHSLIDKDQEELFVQKKMKMIFLVG